MSSEDMAATIVIIIGISLVVVVCLVLAVGYDYLECTNKTSEIGFPSRYKVIGGCQIEVNDGQWIPLDSYYFKQE